MGDRGLIICEQGYDALPSSQPRPESDDDDDDEVEEEEEDNTILVNDSILSTLTNSPNTAHNLLQLKTSIQDFAVEHPFWTQSRLDEEEALEFESDVFEFARAAGLGVNLAKLEVMRAMGAWKTSKGIPIAQAGHVEQIFEKVLETVEVATETISSGQKKKRKREEKEKAIAESVLMDTVEDSQKVEAKEPKAKRQRRREKKRKLADETTSTAGPTSSVNVTSDTAGLTKEEQVETKSQRRQEKKKRKLEEDATSAVGASNSVPISAIATQKAKVADVQADSKSQKVQEQKKPKLDKEAAAKAVSAAKPTAESKSAKRVKNEKKKEKKKRAKQGPTTSSYFAQPEVATATRSKETASPQAESGDVLIEDVLEEKENSVRDDKSAQTEEIKQSNLADKEEKKKKRKKKRNKNRLSEAEIADPLKAAEERTARKIERSAKPKDVSVDIAKSDVPDIPGPAEPSAKKKRVRSRIMKDGQEETKEVDKEIVPKPEAEMPTEPKKIAKHTPSAPKVKETNNSNNPQLAVEVAVIEQAPTKEKSRKRKKKSEIEVEVEAMPVTTEVASPEESQPPKKKPRDRKRKSINKLLDVQVTGVEEPATEPLVELPDTNSEKKKHERDKSKKRSSVGMEVDDQASKEASNSRHS